jgi:hypothetical protein
VSEVEHALVALGRELAVPEPPDVAPRVLGALEAPSQRSRPRLRVAVVVAAVLVAGVLAALAVPEARSALARFFHIGTVRIEVVDELPSVAPEPPELDLGAALGERVSLAEARRRSGDALLELEQEPDAVYVGPRDSVWFVYGAPGGVRLLVAQTSRLSIDEGFILKKLVAAGTAVEGTTVRGRPAYFLSGEPHEILLVDEHGVPALETIRLARDVLLWEEGGRTLRLEGDFSLDEAVEIAESLR